MAACAPRSRGILKMGENMKAILALAVLMLFAIPAGSQTQQKQQQPKSESGRYQIYQPNRDGQPRVFLLDTETGKVWWLAYCKDGVPVWEPMTKKDTMDDAAEFEGKHNGGSVR
jgi:hypothetical protein